MFFIQNLTFSQGKNKLHSGRMFLSGLTLLLPIFYLISAAGCGAKAPPSAAKDLPSPFPISIFLVAPAAAKRPGISIGCDETLVPITIFIGQQPSDPLEASLNALFKTQGPTGLYNALAGQSLTVSHLDYRELTAKIYLVGELQPAGVCDLPRMQEQLRQTALHAGKLEEVAIFINGQTLEQYLSLAGS